MIRIDEIYYNVFVCALQHRPDVSIDWFDPFGSVRYRDLRTKNASLGRDDTNRFLFWDQEPIYEHTARVFFDQYLCQYHRNVAITIVTSEKCSQDLDRICSLYGLRSDYYFFHGWAALDWYRGYNHSYLSKAWSTRSFQYAFMCANNIIGGDRAHRIRLFSELIKRDLVQNNLISFPKTCPYHKVPAQDLAQQLGIDLGSCDLPRIIDSDTDHSNDSHCIDFWTPGTGAFAHVVTETVYDSPRLHLTEKTFKPIVMQQPFVLVAPQHSLAYLREYGFQTFDCIWNEDYDNLSDCDRIPAIADLLKDISSWSPHRQEMAQRRVALAVEHNFNWFYGGFQDLLWNELSGMIGRW